MCACLDLLRHGDEAFAPSIVKMIYGIPLGRFYVSVRRLEKAGQLQHRFVQMDKKVYGVYEWSDDFRSQVEGLSTMLDISTSAAVRQLFHGC